MKYATIDKKYYDYYDNKGTIQRVYRYMIDSKYREVVDVRMYLKNNFIDVPELIEQKAQEFKTRYGDNYDAIAIAVLRFVRSNIKYISDTKKFGYGERWEHISNVWETRKGDCESGATLIYVMCRLAGIPEYKLFMFAGDVYDPFTKKEAGHAYCVYRPQPNWFVTLDWCYYYKSTGISVRPKFFVSGKTIKGEDPNYHTIWFSFNETKSIIEFKPTYKTY